MLHSAVSAESSPTPRKTAAVPLPHGHPRGPPGVNSYFVSSLTLPERYMFTAFTHFVSC